MVITIASTSTAGIIKKKPYVDSASTGAVGGGEVDSSEEDISE